MDDDSYIIKDWAIVTVPRVGSHYLQERIFAHTGKLIVKYHEPKPQTWGYAIKGLLKRDTRFWSGLQVDKLKIITIVRDPKDLLTSHVSLAIKQRHKGFIVDDENPLNIDNIKILAEEYRDNYLKLEKSSVIVIHYDQLISFPFEVTSAIANRMGIDIVTDKYETSLVDFDDYVVSSKQLPEYNDIKNIINDIDISDFYQAYDKISSRVIAL